MKEFLLFITLAALVSASELEDNEQKKRGASKTTTSLNAIPSGAQKPEYTYSIYSQPSQNTYQTQPTTYQTQPSTYQTQPTYQNQASYQTQQVPNSFYPSQGNQYYTTGSSQTAQTYPQQPQISLLPPVTQSFVPINFVPSQPYQSKYSVPAKAQNPVQYVLQPIQQPVASVYPYQNLLSPNQNHHIGPISPQNLVATNLASIPFHNQYFGHIGHPSMLLFGQPNSLFSNLFYQNPLQNLYNYYPNSQPKYTPSYVNQAPVEYDKLQGQATQSVGKDENDISPSTNSDYLSPQESVNYKNSYSRSSYTSKL